MADPMTVKIPEREEAFPVIVFLRSVAEGEVQMALSCAGTPGRPTEQMLAGLAVAAQAMMHVNAITEEELAAYKAQLIAKSRRPN